jgi:phytoene dehydrogenase-like protein
MSATRYDALVIGAGMSGLACALRLAMFGKRVRLLEKHAISGGLNSYYQRKVQGSDQVRKFDVGLHALTNFSARGEKGTPLSKICKQLRLSWDDWALEEQTYSRTLFGGVELRFANGLTLLSQEIHEKFPQSAMGFQSLLDDVQTFDEVNLQNSYSSARERLSRHITEPLLAEMLLAPLLIYGSSWENDMDWSQFVILFKAIYLQGFCRPQGGVRTILEKLLTKAEELGVEISFRSEVAEILCKDATVQGVRLKNQEILLADQVYSSMGLPETKNALYHPSPNDEVSLPQPLKCIKPGKLSFVEVLLVYPGPLKSDCTITFFNESAHYHYQKPETLIDSRSAVICHPKNYQSREGEMQNSSREDLVRLTFMANYELWKKLSRTDYLEEKKRVARLAHQLIQAKLSPHEEIPAPVFEDVFTPTTVERYTFHHQGCVYGSETKLRDGRTGIEGLVIIGTDQGFLGIVGSLLSGISMANYHGFPTLDKNVAQASSKVSSSQSSVSSL